MLGVGVLSAIMSTSDGLFISIAVIFSNDLYKRTLAPVIHKNKSEQQIDRIALNISRVAIVIVGIVAVWLASDRPKFLAVLLWIGIGGIVSGAAGPLALETCDQSRRNPVISHRGAAVCLSIRHLRLEESVWRGRHLRHRGFRGDGSGQPVDQTFAAGAS
jgi:hypothetical protein